MLGQGDVFDAERQNGLCFAYRVLHLPLDLVRLVRGGRQDEQADTAVRDGVNDGVAPVLAGRDVARSHPAADAVPFQSRTDRVGDRLVQRRVTDENVVMCHCRLLLSLVQHRHSLLETALHPVE